MALDGDSDGASENSSISSRESINNNHLNGTEPVTRWSALEINDPQKTTSTNVSSTMIVTLRSAKSSSPPGFLCDPQKLFAEPYWRPSLIQPSPSVETTDLAPAPEDLYLEDTPKEFEHTSFERFQRLPIELRLAVFALALPAPSLVQVKHIVYPKNKIGHRGIGFIVQYTSLFSASDLRSTRHMGMLSANSESRSVYLQANPIVLPMVLKGCHRGANKLYISTDDILYFSSLLGKTSLANTMDALSHGAWAKQLKHIALFRFNCHGIDNINIQSWIRPDRGPSWLDFLKIFEGVKEVKLAWEATPIRYQGLKFEEFDQGPRGIRKYDEDLAEWYGPQGRAEKLRGRILANPDVVKEGLAVPEFVMF